MATKCIQLDFLLSDKESYKNWEIGEFKKKTFKSIRGLFARHNEMKSQILELKKLISDLFQYQMETSSKVVRFESDVEEVVRSTIDMDKAFLNVELLDYKHITDKSLRSLSVKYNEMEATLLDLQRFMGNIVFKEMENRAHA